MLELTATTPRPSQPTPLSSLACRHYPAPTTTLDPANRHYQAPTATLDPANRQHLRPLALRRHECVFKLHFS